MTKERFITVEEVLDRVCISRTQLYRHIKANNFPQQVPLGPYKIAFVETEIDAWIAARLEARRNGEGKEKRRQRALHSVSHK